MSAPAAEWGGVPLPAISVALSAHDGERFLEEQLESLARQSVPPAELVACDDCSSDGTAGILESFSRRAPFPVRVFRNERNLGFNDSFILTAERCESSLVAFCDQDDVWAETKIGTCARFFAEHAGVRLVMHAGQPVDRHLRPIGGAYPPVTETRVVPPLRANPWLYAPSFALVFDKALLRLADWERRPPSRDLDGHAMDFDEWVYSLAWAVGDVGFIGERLVRYRQHGANLFGVTAPGWRGRLRTLLTEDFATHVGRTATARAYAEVFAQAGRTQPSEDDRARLAAAARYWQAYEQLSRQRDTVYGTQRLTARARRFAALVAARAYRSRERGGFGRSALLRDLREVARPDRGAGGTRDRGVPEPPRHVSHHRTGPPELL